MTEQSWLQILVEMVKSGGMMALWGVLGFQFLSVVKASIGWVFSIFIVRSICGTLANIFKWCLERDASQLEKLLAQATEKK